MTLSTLIPVSLFFPVLRKTLITDKIFNPKKATQFIVRLAGDIFMTAKRLKGSKLIGFERTPEVAYFFDENSKGFIQTTGDLNKYSKVRLQEWIEGSQQEDIMTADVLHIQQKSHNSSAIGIDWFSFIPAVLSFLANFSKGYFFQAIICLVIILSVAIYEH